MSRLLSGRAFAAILAMTACTTMTPSARAQKAGPSADKLACFKASDAAQQLRAAGKLLAARDALHACIQDACPGVVRQSCAQWLAEVQASLPSIVVTAKDGQGRDLADLKVLIDGAVLTEHLGGLAFQVYPGHHKMRYEKADGAFLEEDVVVAEGVRNRELHAAFPGPAVATIAPVAVHDGARVASPLNTGMATTFAIVGAGLLGTALYLDVSTTSNVHADRAPTGCAPNCSQSRVDGYQRDYDLAGVGLGVGLAAAGVAIYVLVAHPFGARASAATTTGSASIHLVPSPHGSGLGWSF